MPFYTVILLNFLFLLILILQTLGLSFVNENAFTKIIRKCSAKQAPDLFLKKHFTGKVNNFYNVPFQQFLEAVNQLCSVKDLPEKFLKKSICSRVSFLTFSWRMSSKSVDSFLYNRDFRHERVKGFRTETLLKGDSDTGVFLWIFQNFSW